MKRKGKQTLTPKLRFPEFREDPIWSEAKLKDLISTVTPPAKLQTSTYLKSGMYPVVDQSQEPICGWTNDASTVITESLPLIVFGDHTCALKFVEQPFAQGADGIKILKANPTISIEYLFHSINHQPLVMEEYKRHFSMLKERRVFFPDIESGEQQKIAECLSSLDGLIAAGGRMLEALKAHKKGLMQQLFPQPGQTQPRLRFPEFRDKGGWGEKKLSEITAAIFDGTHQTPTYTEAGIPFYSVENLISGNANKFISKEDYDLATKKNKPEKGDILLTRIGKIGFSQVVTWDHKFSVYVTLAVIKRSSQFNSHYLHCLMQSDFYQSELRSKSLSIAVPPKINMDSLRETKVLIPSPAEQQRIADCLTALDDRIAAQAAKIDALKTHKRGLMQQLFPAPEVS